MKKIYLALIIVFCLIHAYSQTEQDPVSGENFILSQPLNNNESYEYTARDFIRMISDQGTGFAYAPQQGQSFHAKIDPYLVFPPEEGETGGPTGGVVGNDGVVGVTPGSFSVSETGEAKYFIPLEFPGGIGGMTPDLSLIYSSNGADGILGPGWSLGGLSVISQVPATRYHNGHKSAAFGGDYRSKAYTLDGQRLILMAQEGDVKLEFRKEQDDFSRIIRKPRIVQKDDNVYYFEVKTKSGLTYYYGENNDALLHFTLGEDDICVAYYVNRIVDNFGNTIQFNYENDVNTREIYIDKISYTHTTNAIGELNPATYEINFEYIDRNVALTSYYNYQPANSVNHGISFKSAKLIANIECTHISEGFVKKYQLDYIKRGPGPDPLKKKQHLSYVQEFGLVDEIGENVR
nr:hypothetical protein [Bacteroidota bacterium]